MELIWSSCVLVILLLFLTRHFQLFCLRFIHLFYTMYLVHAWSSWMITPAHVCACLTFFAINSVLLLPQWAGPATMTPTQLYFVNLLPLFFGGRTSPILNFLCIYGRSLFHAHIWLSLMALVSAIIHTIKSTANKTTDTVLIISGISALSSLALSCVIAPWSFRRFGHILLLLHRLLPICTILATAWHLVIVEKPWVSVPWALVACASLTAAIMLGGRIMRSHYMPVQIPAVEMHGKVLITLPKQPYGTMGPSCFYLHHGRHGEFVPVTWWEQAENGGLQCVLFTGLTRFRDLSPKVTGPFFDDMSFLKYETVMLVADGTGILALLPIMLAIASRKRHDMVQHERPFGDVTRKVNLLWKVDNDQQVQQISRYFETIYQWETGRIARQHLHIMEFYPDQFDLEGINNSRHKQFKWTDDKNNWQAYNVAMFNNNVSGIIQHDSLRTPGRTIVMACGPAVFTRTIQDTVEQHIDSNNIIDFRSIDGIYASSLANHDEEKNAKTQ